MRRSLDVFHVSVHTWRAHTENPPRSRKDAPVIPSDRLRAALKSRHLRFPGKPPVSEHFLIV